MKSLEKARHYLFQITMPLRPTLVTAVVMSIIITGLAVGISAYKNSVKSIHALWINLSTEIADRSSSMTLDFLKSAQPFLHFTESLTETKQVDITNPFTVMSYCASALESFPQFIWIYYVNTDGTALGAMRTEDPKLPIAGWWLSVDPKSTQDQPKTINRRFRYTTEQKWVQDSLSTDNYDPRTRPYWNQGLSNPLGSWSSPYVFLRPVGTEGITYITPDYEGNKLQGMWLVDYLVNVISDFLQTLQVGKTGEVILVADDGTLVATSRMREIIESDHKTLKNLEELKDDDQILADVWDYLRQNNNISSEGFESARFEFGDYLGYIQSFPTSSGIPWNVLTIVPKEEFFGPIVRQAWIAALVALSICFVFALIAGFFFGRISQKLKKVAVEMNKIGAFEITEETFSDKFSFIREVNVMNAALDKMKSGLSSFSKYVPTQLVSELIRSGHPAKLGGEKTDMTILFSDLGHFTKFAEMVPTQDLVKTLGDYLTEMTDVMQQNQGVVDKYFADTIMTFWGAPIPIKNHAYLACKTALEMKKKANAFWDRVAEKHGIKLYVRIGINTGEIIVGNFGSPLRMDYTAIGDPVNLASRLEGLNKLYETQIMIGEETAERVEAEMICRPLDYVVVKGKEKPALVFELLCEKKDATPDQQKGIDIYIAALNLYVQRKFEEAIGKFEEASNLLGGSDAPSRVLIARCKEYIIDPPPAHWQGVSIMDLKF